MTMNEWLDPSGNEHLLYPAEAKLKNKFGQSLLDVYAVRRPDMRWSLLLINKDSKNAYPANIKFKNGEVEDFFKGKVELYQFSRRQYKWNEKLARPTKDLPPEHKIIHASGKTTKFFLPSYSLTVLRGKIS